MRKYFLLLFLILILISITAAQAITNFSYTTFTENFADNSSWSDLSGIWVIESGRYNGSGTSVYTIGDVPIKVSRMQLFKIIIQARNSVISLQDMAS